MAEYTGIGQGTYNTVAGSIGLASAVLGGGGLGNLFGGWNRNYMNTPDIGMCALAEAQTMAEKDAEIARLRSEKYADNVGIEVYKEIKKDLNDFKDAQADKWTAQAVVNEHLTDAVKSLGGQAQRTAEVLGEITRIAVPSNAICDFNGRGCAGCGNNI